MQYAARVARLGHQVGQGLALAPHDNAEVPAPQLQRPERVSCDRLDLGYRW